MVVRPQIRHVCGRVCYAIVRRRSQINSAGISRAIPLRYGTVRSRNDLDVAPTAPFAAGTHAMLLLGVAHAPRWALIVARAIDGNALPVFAFAWEGAILIGLAQDSHTLTIGAGRTRRAIRVADTINWSTLAVLAGRGRWAVLIVVAGDGEALAVLAC